MTAVIYARYSSDNQSEESIEGQIRECKEGTQTISFDDVTEAASKENGSDLDCIPAPRKTSTRMCTGFSFSV